VQRLWKNFLKKKLRRLKGISKNPLLRKNSYARHLLRQLPLECVSTPAEGFLVAAIPIRFFFNQTGF
jgi:hypothetical protein